MIDQDVAVILVLAATGLIWLAGTWIWATLEGRRLDRLSEAEAAKRHRAPVLKNKVATGQFAGSVLAFPSDPQRRSPEGLVGNVSRQGNWVASTNGEVRKPQKGQ